MIKNDKLQICYFKQTGTSCIEFYELKPRGFRLSESDYHIQRQGEANCKNVLALMSLNARQGENLVLKIDGPDEKQAAGFLNGLLRTIL